MKISFFILFFLVSVLSHAKGVSDHSIVFGQSADLTGVAQHLGVNMRAGILAAFEEANKEGGIYGRKLKLISLDDSYEPESAIINTRTFINKYKVFALIGAVGTPTSKAVASIVSEANIPYIGPFTGAEFLRDPSQKNVVNVRASYYQEIRNIVERLVSDLKIKKISILYQDDSYGQAGFTGLEMALKKKNMEIASSGVYMRNTTAVKTALLDIMAGQPEAVLIVGAYRPAADFIKKARTVNFNPLFLSLSFVGTNALYKELENHLTPVVITQVVPFPYNVRNSLVASYQKAVKDNFNFVSLEGYLVGKFTVMALKEAGRRLTAEKFVKAIRQIKQFSVDGFPLQYGLKDNQGSDKVFLTAIFKGQLFPISNLKAFQDESKE
ncbi:MAG: ABC transporter substrate-binding protein [Oligoflexia bacterium]|nr:ABC transporter substrate-binding protein [Oligoflexia bacterium]